MFVCCEQEKQEKPQEEEKSLSTYLLTHYGSRRFEGLVQKVLK